MIDGLVLDFRGWWFMLNRNCKTMDHKTWKWQRAIAIYLGHVSRKGQDLNSGFSLIESLVAAVVVGIMIVSIAPMVALSTSARVNARRMDQATQAGRSYIDAVRGGVIDVSAFPSYLIRNQLNAQAQYVFEDATAPSNSIQPPTVTQFDPTNNKICNNTLTNNVQSGKVPGICVDAGGGGFSVNDPQDLFIQPMRSGSNDSNELNRQGFWLAIRVYRADALAGTAPLRTGSDPTCAASKTPFSSSSSVTCPIMTMRSQILPVTNQNNFDDISKGIGKTP